MIPKIIHTCWFSKDDYFSFSEKIKQCLDSWKTYCPDYKIKVWTLSDWTELENYPHAKQCLEAGIYSYPYLKNLFRFWVLFNHGGWYIDSDIFLRNSLDIFSSEKLILCSNNPEEISGKIIASEKGNTLIKRLMDSISSKTWIKKDNSLSLYNIEQHIFNEIWREGYIFPNTTISERCLVNGISLYPKDYFISGEMGEGKYSIHLESEKSKKISIIMPIYNSEKFLSESINSILSQDFTDFELLCIDDGSTDTSSDIIKSYNDDRVVYIRKNHSGIVDSLNIGINRAVGTYLVRMDSDDIMLPNRLSHQYKYMEKNPKIDILGSGFQWGNGKSIPEYFKPQERTFSIKDFKDGNVIAHPTVIMRRDSILKLPYFYESYFQGCEDYKLWIHAIKHGLNVSSESTPVIIYRQHSGQETTKQDYFSKTAPLLSQIKRMYIGYKTEKIDKVRLTCIIPFQNEGSEIERTVANIRGTAGGNVDIILINDASTDDYDYKWIADNYSCKYIHNEENLGVAGSRDLGVKTCKTEYFVLLDGHMRFYHDNWHVKLLQALDDNPESIVTSNTIVMTYDKETKIYSNEGGIDGRDRFGSFGAYVNMEETGWEFTGKWTSKIMEGINHTSSIIPISCCMGAVYASSVTFWEKLGGLQGLSKYGLDEPLISIKTWMAGGKVLLIKDWGVGHLYRGSSPYSVPLKHVDQNQIYLINLFNTSPEKIKYYENNLRKRVGDKRFSEAKDVFNNKKESFEEFKRYFHSEVVKHSLDWYLEEINNKCFYKRK